MVFEPAKLRHERHYKAKRIFVVLFSSVVLLTIYFLKDATLWLRTVSTLTLVIGFYVIDHILDLRYKTRHYVFIVLIAIASFMLSPLYFISPNYDKFQHFIQPMFTFSLVFHLIRKLPIRLRWQITLSLLATIAILSLFEIGEFSLDKAFDTKLQGVYIRDMKGLEKFNLIMDKNDDTMTDLILGAIGSGMYSISYAVCIFIRTKQRAKTFKRGINH